MRMSSWRWAGAWLASVGAVLPIAHAQNDPTAAPRPVSPSPEPDPVAPSAAQSAPAQGVPQELVNLRNYVAAMRTKENFAPADLQNLRSWLALELANLDKLDPAAPDFMASLSEALKAFHATLNQYLFDPPSKPAFITQGIAQLAALAAEALPKPDLSYFQAMAISGVLRDAKKIEALPGLKAGLTSKYPAVRYYSAAGLKDLEPAVASAGQLNDVVSAVRAAGVKETSYAVRARMYRVLAVPNQAGAVFDAILAIMDARNETLRKGGVMIEKDISVPVIYLRSEAAQGRINSQQAEALVKRLAIILRACAEQFASSAQLSFDDETTLELTLSETEALLEQLTRTSGGVRKALETRDPAVKQNVLEAARAWYGGADKPGVLNSAPWNVETGTP